jgi:hypothetical protein
LRTPEVTVWVSDAEPHRVVRVGSGHSGDGGLVPVADGSGAFGVDLGELSAAQTDQLFDQLEAKTRTLSDAVDADVSFALNGSATLEPCGDFGCQADVTLTNEVAADSPAARRSGQVTASITVSMSLDGRPVRTCAQNRTMPPNGSTSLTCYAAYTIAPATGPTTHSVYALARAVARAVVAADIPGLVTNLREDQQRGRTPRTPCNSFPAGTRVLLPNGQHHD